MNATKMARVKLAPGALTDPRILKGAIVCQMGF